jgi:hypothetical protein
LQAGEPAKRLDGATPGAERLPRISGGVAELRDSQEGQGRQNDDAETGHGDTIDKFDEAGHGNLLSVCALQHMGTP